MNNTDFDRRRKDMEDEFDSLWRKAMVVWVVMAVLGFGLIGLVAWAIVKLVNHFA